MPIILSLILAMGLSLPIDPSHTQEKNSSGNEIFDQWGDLLVEHFNLEDMKVITRIIWCESSHSKEPKRFSRWAIPNHKKDC